ncbi:unnamed protein product [Ixodes persulcatus]
MALALRARARARREKEPTSFVGTAELAAHKFDSQLTILDRGTLHFSSLNQNQLHINCLKCNAR